MPRDRVNPKNTATQANMPVLPGRALVASAVRFPARAQNIYRPAQDWQRECYRHYAICGEARFAARFVGNALARCTLGIGTVDPGTGKTTPETTGAAKKWLDQLFAGPEGQSQMLSAIGVHLTIAGECYLIGRETPQGDQWEVASVLEVKSLGNGWAIDYQDGHGARPLGDKDSVIRIWLQSPGVRIEADSPFRALLPSLSEIEWATRHIFAQEQSRLAGAGLLLLPSEVTFPPPPPRRGEDGQTRAQTTTDDINGIMAVLAEAMTTAIKDPSNPASLVPIPVKMPGEYIDKVKLLHFWSQLDEKVLEMRNNAIERFADGMDLPREQVLGMSSNRGTGGGSSNGVSHWGAWQIEESTIKLHIEPMLQMVTAGITMQYLRPLPGVKPNEIVTSSTAELRLRPDRSKESIELNAIGLVKDEAVLRENGFDPSDAMGDEERKLWLLRKIASGSATPDQVAAAAKVFGINLPAPEPKAQQETRESRPAPSLEEHPTRPRTPAEAGVTDALVAVSNAIVTRALERVGNRLRNKHDIKPPNVPSWAMHTLVQCNGDANELLSDAFTTAPMLLDGIAEDPAYVVEVLEAYCRTLMFERAEHDRDRLAAYMETNR